jgi:hypothetical protein
MGDGHIRKEQDHVKIYLSAGGAEGRAFLEACVAMFPGGRMTPVEWDGVKTSKAYWTSRTHGGEALMQGIMPYLGPLARGAHLLMCHFPELPESSTMRGALQHAGFSLHDEDGFWHF